MGISTVFPGSIVLVNNYKSEFDGYWVVEEARHVINTNHYMTHLHIKTDSTNQDPLQGSVGKNVKKHPGSRLYKDTWVTDKDFSYVY
jgi:hypothetical protein